MQNYLSPEYLKKGDTIGIISTARKISEEEINIAIESIEQEGYKVVLGKYLFEEDHQFSGTVQQRVSDLHSMFLQEDVKAILCARGGYGTVQLLPYLDSKIISQNPKWLIGYSDVTVLHSFLHQQFKIQSLHATMPINFSSYQNTDLPMQSMFQALAGKNISYKIPVQSPYDKQGKATGVLIGGNLSILYSLRGTFADIDTDGKILFIEDLDEYLYHIDRMMMNLKLGGKLEKLKALIVGGMSQMNDNTIPYGKTAKEIIQTVTAEYNYPVVFDFPAGHINDNYALPLGKIATLDVTSNHITLSF